MYPDLVITVFLILSLFIVSALVIFSARHIKNINPDTLPELWRLYGVEILIVTAVLIPAYYGGVILMIVLLLFNLRAHVEIAHIHGYRHRTNIIATGILLSSVLIITVFYLSTAEQAISYLLSSIVLFISLVLFILVMKKCQTFLAALFPMLIIALSISSLLQINMMHDGFLLIIFLYLVTETNDAFAMIFGRLVGKTGLFPRISPKKTWEGMIAGVMTAMLAGLVYNHLVLNYTVSEASMIIGLIIISAILGDLVFSAYKRIYETKDFMTLIKGHGGIIDIYDSLLISSITFYFLIQLTGSSNSSHSIIFP